MIVVRNLVKTIRNGAHEVEIIRDVSFEVPSRQFVAVMGPSGSGKSTLLGLIAGLDWPSSGNIFIDGQDITTLPEDRMAQLRGKKLGFVFQSYHLIPTLTARTSRRCLKIGWLSYEERNLDSCFSPIT